MKLTIVYDNTTTSKRFQSGWGFSALIEKEGVPTILFDTGGNGRKLLGNMEKLNIDPNKIQEVFISHPHGDHTGGLSAFLSKNKNVDIWAPLSFHGGKGARNVFKLGKAKKLHKGVYSTGELEGIEQSLCLETKRGIIIVAGCSHPQMEHILSTASQFGNVYGIIGGLHGTRAQSLTQLKLICPTHCTQHKRAIKKLNPERYIEGGVGTIIEI